jgi:hypothetical protein
LAPFPEYFLMTAFMMFCFARSLLLEIRLRSLS